MRTSYQDRMLHLLDVYAERPTTVETLAPSVKRAKYHGDQCDCTDCADLRAAMSIYVRNKRIYDSVGFV